MKQETTEHPGFVLKRMLKEHDLTQVQLADATQMDRSHLTHIMGGRRPIHAELAAKLAQALGTTPEFWMGLQQAYDLSQYQRRHGIEIGQVKPLVRQNTPRVRRVEA